MGIALVVFLVVIPVALVFLAARPPSAASLRRLAATMLLPGVPVGGADAVAARIRRRRLGGAVGGVAGLWATAAWRSTTFSWDGLLAPFDRGSPVGLTAGWFTLGSAGFVLAVNVFGILIGFAAGVVIAEWTGRAVTAGERRTALLTPRDSHRYLARWARPAVGTAAVAAVTALALAAVVPESLKTATVVVAGSSSSWWWAGVLLLAGAVALGTRSLVLASAPHAATDEDLAAREASRALTTATLTIVALAAFTASTASTLARISTWFGWGWGDGTATAAIALSLLAEGLVVASFCTPYWIIGLKIDTSAPIAA
jgi:hypothetical protein